MERHLKRSLHLEKLNHYSWQSINLNASCLPCIQSQPGPTWIVVGNIAEPWKRISLTFIDSVRGITTRNSIQRQLQISVIPLNKIYSNSPEAGSYTRELFYNAKHILVMTHSDIFLLFIVTPSAPIGAWEVKLSALLGNYDRPTNQPTVVERTDGLIGKFHFQIQFNRQFFFG